MTQTQTDLLLYVDQKIHHSGSQRGNPLSPLHGLLFSMGSKGSFFNALSHKEYTTLCYTSRGALAKTGNSSVGPL